MKKNTGILINNNIGIVILKEGTTKAQWQYIEDFFISAGLFLASKPKGIVVSDITKANELINKLMRLEN